MKQEFNASSTTTIDQHLIVFYNVENLFPPDSFSIRKNKRKVSGLRNWNKERYENKIHKLGRVFELFEQEYSLLPDLIGLSEIQGSGPLEDLLKLPVFKSEFSFIHFESMDERGVDVALLYNHTKVKIEKAEPLVYFFEIPDLDPENYDTTRDVLHTTVRIGCKALELYVVHLPSKRSDDVNLPKRRYILSEINKRVQEHQKEKESVVVLGDFNEDPEHPQMLEFLEGPDGPLLFNPFRKLYNDKKYSTFHHNRGLLFDQIILSQDFMGENQEGFTFKNASVFNHPQIANFDRKNSHRPFRTYAGTRYLGGYSDHFPVLLSLNNQENQQENETHF